MIDEKFGTSCKGRDPLSILDELTSNELGILQVSFFEREIYVEAHRPGKLPRKETPSYIAKEALEKRMRADISKIVD
jgi:hypothetical protein